MNSEHDVVESSPSSRGLPITTPSPTPPLPVMQLHTLHSLPDSPIYPPFTPGHERAVRRPTNAHSMLMKSLAAQKNAQTSSLAMSRDGSSWRLRLQQLRRQQERREAMNAKDEEYSQCTAEMLEEVVAAEQQRLTTLSPNGRQAFVFQNQDVYEGEWKNSKMHGRGMMRRGLAKDMYEGNWFLGLRSGTGMYHSAVYHTFYTGNWLENRKHGSGQLLEPEGLYTGDFQVNKIHGYGEYVFSSGFVYKGEWVAGLYEGRGTLTEPCGTRYEGRWREGYEHGRGTRTFNNGDVYTGEWAFGAPHGRGTYISIDFQYEGEWQYGSIMGKGVCYYSNGSRYDGEWRSGRYHGLGSFSTAERAVTYLGEFKDGKRHGRGEYNSGLVYYNGEWSEDKKCGVGMARLKQSGYYHGQWKDDLPDGRCTYRLWDEEMVWYADGVCEKVEDISSFRAVGVKVTGKAQTKKPPPPPSSTAPPQSITSRTASPLKTSELLEGSE